MAALPSSFKKGPSFMDNSTKIMLGIKDSHLELDQNFTEPVEDQGDQIVVHLVQS
ncbi:ISL3 family transposase, partial [Lactobacillus sp. Marseille-P7033]|nr:ISL3 family transposase [Lactobacillus sp. Marseille-P7033]